MAVPKRKTSKSRQGKRRSHIHLKKPHYITCPNCGEPILPNRVCPHCGYYKGRKVLDLEVE